MEHIAGYRRIISLPGDRIRKARHRACDGLHMTLPIKYTPADLHQKAGHVPTSVKKGMCSDEYEERGWLWGHADKPDGLADAAVGEGSVVE